MGDSMRDAVRRKLVYVAVVLLLALAVVVGLGWAIVRSLSFADP